MSKLSKICLILTLTIFVMSVSAQEKFNYPATKKVEQVDDYHGTKVADPFRWLEDPIPLIRERGLKRKTN